VEAMTNTSPDWLAPLVPNRRSGRIVMLDLALFLEEGRHVSPASFFYPLNLLIKVASRSHSILGIWILVTTTGWSGIVFSARKKFCPRKATNINRGPDGTLSDSNGSRT
jgi:hypothetical protein